MQISQRTEAGTPSRSVSRRDIEQLRRPSTREMVDEQAGSCGKMREAEDDAMSDAEIDAKADELSDIETESENDGEKPVECWEIGLQIQMVAQPFLQVSLRTQIIYP